MPVDAARVSTWDEYLDLQDAGDLPAETTAPAAPVAAPQPASLAALADELCLPPAFLHEVDALIRDKGQIVFTGPPGSGKTYVARRLAAFYAGGEVSRFEFLQFHPSYAYEDFVQGLRPKPDEATGLLTFEAQNGPLLDVVKRAQEASDDAIHVMVIDEINRGNVARVFGELFFALEYRDQRVRLQYSPQGTPLQLPENLWFIGTMNTADRSIALFDAALRRRFYFVDFSPLSPPFDGVLRCFLDKLGNGMEWVAAVLAHVNAELPDPRFAVGPSHFMRRDLTPEIAARVWRYTVLPYLADRFPDAAESGRFAWATVVAAAT